MNTTASESRIPWAILVSTSILGPVALLWMGIAKFEPSVSVQLAFGIMLLNGLGLNLIRKSSMLNGLLFLAFLLILMGYGSVLAGQRAVLLILAPMVQIQFWFVNSALTLKKGKADEARQLGE